MANAVTLHSIMLRRFFLLLLTPASLAWAQGNSLTVTASRNATLQPDQVIFSVFVESGLDATREDALAVVNAAGITLANFNGVSTVQESNGQQARLSLVWSFSLPVRFPA